MEKYNITGMSCAACSSRIEKAVSSLEGVNKCSVNLLTNSMEVDSTLDSKIIIETVKKAGYGASKVGTKNNNDNESDIEIENNSKETSLRLKRLISSTILLIILMYFSMGYTMWGFPLPDFLDGNYLNIALIQLLLTIIIMIINNNYFVNGFKALLHRSPNMDTLIALGSSASFLYSLYCLFLMNNDATNGNLIHLEHSLHNLYFESAAMILTLITIGKTLESYSKGKTTNALKSLIKLKPKTAIIIKNNQEIEVEIDKVNVDDIFVVKPFCSIPFDGKIIEGKSSIDESMLTGESLPVDKAENDEVISGTVNQEGYIKCVAKKVGKDTTINQIIKMVFDASSSKAPIAKIADKVSGIFVPTVLIISLITLIVWLICGQNFEFSLTRAISVLVISCPCALGLATPVAIMVGSGKGAKNGILFKSAVSLEETSKCEYVVLDKTGTITKGQMAVTNININESISEIEFLKNVATLERFSDHPLAKAVVKYALEKNIDFSEIEDFEIIPGVGVKGKIDNNDYIGANLKYIKNLISIDSSTLELINNEAEKGKTPLLFLKNNNLYGIIFVSDTIKEDSILAIEKLKKMGKTIIMLTGDNKLTASYIGKIAGVDKIYSEVLPSQKADVIKDLKRHGKVIMVGDGINDALSLTTADIGMAIGAGSEIALDSADIVLMNSSLNDVVKAISLSHMTLLNIKENLFWAFIYNIIGIPLACGIFININGWTMTPMYGAFAMSLSSLFVCLNALRLNIKNINHIYHHRKSKEKEDTKTMEMKKEIVIEGMMCMHCEKHVHDALSKINGVQVEEVSHEKKHAVVVLNENINDEILKTAVEDEGYKVIEIK